MINTSILIYAPTITNRLRYTLDLLFCKFANISVNYTTEKDYFLKYPSAKINYSFDKIADELIFIKSHTLLFEKDIDKKNIDEIFKNSSDEDLLANIQELLLQSNTSMAEAGMKKYLDQSSRNTMIQSAAIRFMSTPEYQLC